MPDEEKPSPSPSRLEQIRKPGIYRNRISFFGTFIALTALGNIVFLFILDILRLQTNPYIGILAYVIFPGILIFGIAIILLGMFLEYRRRLHHAEVKVAPYPRIDFNQPHQRNVFTFVSMTTLFFVLLSAVGSYRAYQYSDSVTFCGQVCHTPMHPEYTAYLASPHARVRCVDCHVGEGAGWYVRSKLSGAYQLYSVTFNKFPRPISTPVHNLRPAQETCEQCHWPERFIGAQMKVITHYGNDEKNTPLQIRLLVKTGGGSPQTGLTAGIHWHMNIANKVYFVSTDPQHQTIPWVRMVDQYGKTTEYKLQSTDMTQQQIDAAPKHRMDCIDCHNRPSHIYVAPDRAVDESILAGRIDQTLPSVKAIAVDALTSTKYKTTPEALDGIRKNMEEAYKSKYADAFASRRARVEDAIEETQRIYQRTIFPEMNVDWRTHPNNIGHFYYPGCFRCHDGNHVSADGKVIRKDCAICHTILTQEQNGTLMQNIPGGEFKHPVDIGDLKDVSCTDCHTGGTGP